MDQPFNVAITYWSFLLQDKIVDGPTSSSFVTLQFHIFLLSNLTTCNTEGLVFRTQDFTAAMTSITMTASFLGSSAVANRSPVATQRRLVVANAARGVEKVKVSYESDKEGNSNGRRNIMFAAAAAAVCTVAGVALADEPKPGTPEAKKVYAPVCVTMPTARVCRN